MVSRRTLVVVLLLVVIGLGIASFTVSADGDSRSLAEELLSGTDPFDADTDDDDDLDDDVELTEYDTDPTVADTDDDGLNDGAEVTEHETDPNEADTDGTVQRKNLANTPTIYESVYGMTS